jgi:hypothetical protein
MDRSVYGYFAFEIGIRHREEFATQRPKTDNSIVVQPFAVASDDFLTSSILSNLSFVEGSKVNIRRTRLEKSIVYNIVAQTLAVNGLVRLMIVIFWS